MFYKKYNIYIHDDVSYNNIKIFRFSYNPFYDTIQTDLTVSKKNKIFAFLEKLKEQAIKDKLCYNSIYPWDDIEDFTYNKEVIIIYNNDTNHIQGWCNIKYDQYILSDNPIHTLFIDKLVTRTSPKIKYIGVILLQFIREIFNKEIIKYYGTDMRFPETYNKYNEIKVDIIYLYSLTTTIDFYKKTYLTQLQSYSEQENNILKHVFIDIHPEKIHTNSSILKKGLLSLNILHCFECNSVLSDESIKQYKDFEPSSTCISNNSPISIDDSIQSHFIDFTINSINSIFGFRKTRRPTKSIKHRKTKSIINKTTK